MGNCHLKMKLFEMEGNKMSSCIINIQINFHQYTENVGIGVPVGKNDPKRFLFSLLIIQFLYFPMTSNKMILSNQIQFDITRKKGGRTSLTKRNCKSQRQSIAENCSHPPSPKSKKFKSSTSKSSIFKIQQKNLQSIDFVCRRTLRLYDHNLEHYKLNQGKLMRAIENEMKERNLNYEQKLLLFLRNRNITLLKIGLNIQKLESQLEILNQFLTEFYEKKRIQQIKILKENFKDEQTLIANQLDLQKLVKLHQNTAFKQTNTNVDFLSEYQNICRKFGAFEPNLKSYIGIRKQLNYCQKDIVDHFEQLRRLKTQGINPKRKKQ